MEHVSVSHCEVVDFVGGGHVCVVGGGDGEADGGWGSECMDLRAQGLNVFV